MLIIDKLYFARREKTMTEHYTHIKDETAGDVINLVSQRIKKNAF